MYVIAEFREKETLVRAIQRLKENGVTVADLDVFSEEPVEFHRGILDRPSRMSLAAVDSLTTVSSHELCESITDPVPGMGWYDQSYGEIGDLCVGQTKKVGQYTVQQEWSNQASSCV